MPKPRIVFVQSGCYSAGWRNFRDGGEETYRDQRITVDFVEGLSADHVVTTLCISRESEFTELAPDLWSVGISRTSAWDRRTIARILDRIAPDLVVLRSPNRDAVRWAQEAALPTLPIFADYFPPPSRWSILSRRRRRMWRLRAPCFCNHSLNASRSLIAHGVAPGRIVPWEFRRISPNAPAKSSAASGELKMVYVGEVSAAKGVTDCIEACRILRDRGLPMSLTIAGSGDLPLVESVALRQRVRDFVHPVGRIPLTRVAGLMRDHDIVLVPSRHEYPEGIPNTIFEALASRTPLVASDHPAFADRLHPGSGSIQFKASRPHSLADAVETLVGDRSLYARISEHGATTLESLYVGTEWSEVVRRFIEDPTNRGGWVEPISLAAHASA